MMVAAAALGALVIYALLGGADYGGGLWDLLARGPRAERQRALIERSIAPVWEANHVWLIVVVVVLFVGFPRGYAAISIALHLPLTLLLVGIVLRGTAFTFRHYDHSSSRAPARWGRVFAWASVLSPLMLGITLGALSAGTVDIDTTGGEDRVTSGLLSSWLAPLPLAAGALALALFAFLSAVYLCVEAEGDEALAGDFRRRALGAGVAVALAALVGALAAGPRSVFGAELLRGRFTWPVQAATGFAALVAFGALLRRRYRLARAAAIAQVTLILVGWGLAQLPYLVAPDLSLEEAAAPRATLVALLVALVAGALVLVPCLYWLLRVFKRQPAFAELDEPDE